MQNFLSTLVQLSGTLLGIFLAAITAYFVFSQDRSAQLEEKVEQKKLEIRDLLIDLRNDWPWMLWKFYLPGDFKEKILSKYPGSTHPEFIERASLDLLFDREGYEEKFSELTDIEFSDGRAFFWILSEFVYGITVGSTDPLRRKAEDVFPFSPQGPGFEQWLSLFDDYLLALGGISLQQSTDPERWPLNFQKHINENIVSLSKTNLLESYRNATFTFFETINLLKSRISEIEKLKLQKKPYAFSYRINCFSISILVGVAIVLGIILPLGFLAMTRYPSSTVAIVLSEL